jgi:rhodanese-related sulfurtransferase
MAQAYGCFQETRWLAGGGEGTLRGMPTTTLAASPAEAHAHFTHKLAVETDAADVAAALRTGAPRFVLLDARSREAYGAGHLPGAVSLPHAEIDEDALAALPGELIVTYCWGPGCNGATRAAANVSALGREVKEMIGGYEYWVREGHPVETGLDG